MDINRFTEKLQEAVRAAQSKAIRYGHQQIDVEHLLAALLEQEGGLAASILLKAGINLESVARRLDAELDRMPKVSGPSGAPDQIYRHRAAEPAAYRGRGRGAASSRTNTSPWSTFCWRPSTRAAPPGVCSRNPASPASA